MAEFSPPQRRCIIDATIEPLRPYRRGFARSKSGPFHDPRTVHALVNVGALRVIRRRRGSTDISVTALSTEKDDPYASQS